MGLFSDGILAQFKADGMTEAWAEGWIEAWAEGWAEGVREGKAEGVREGKADGLLRLAERQFGPVPAGIRQCVYAADATTLDHWADHFFDAPNLEVAFAPVVAGRHERTALI